MNPNETKCPYCGHKNKVDSADRDGFDPEEPIPYQCRKCDKEFIFYYTVIIDYEDGEECPCMNGDPCDMKHAYSMPLDNGQTNKTCPICSNEIID